MTTNNHDSDVVHKLFYLASQTLSDAEDSNPPENLQSLYIVFEKIFVTSVASLETNPTDWKYVDSILLQLSVIQKTAKSLNWANAAFREIFLSAILSNDIWKCLLGLVGSSQRIVEFKALSTISCIVFELCGENTLTAHLENLTTFMLNFCWSSDGSKFDHVLDIMTSILKKFKKEDTEVPDMVLSEISKQFCAFIQQMPNIKDERIFYSYLSLCNAVLDNSQVINNQMLECIPLLLEQFPLHLLTIQRRLTYLQFLKNLLPFPPTKSHSEVCVISARAYISYATASKAALCELFSFYPDFVGFGGRNVQGQSCNLERSKAFSKCERTSLLNGLLRSVCTVMGEDDVSDAENTIASLLLAAGDTDMCGSIFDTYFDQDDAMVEMLLLHLVINVSQSQSSQRSHFLSSPHSLFATLLQHLSFDASVLLDWLTSNETQFLLYLLKYLKYTATTFKEFSEACVCISSPECDIFSCVMLTLVKLRNSIEKLCAKNLFPYPVKPLLKQIYAIESLANK